MITVIIQRQPSTDEGTFGKLMMEGFECVTLELPWKNNQRRVSCIPAGEYKALRHKSPSKGWCYELRDVPGRSDILIHSGNWAGDTEKGWSSDYLGCIGLGKSRGYLLNREGKTQRVILSSRLAMQAFHEATKGEPLTIIIKDANHGA